MFCGFGFCQFVAPLVIYVAGMPPDPLAADRMFISEGIEFLPQVSVQNWPLYSFLGLSHPSACTPFEPPGRESIQKVLTVRDEQNFTGFFEGLEALDGRCN